MPARVPVSFRFLHFSDPVPVIVFVRGSRVFRSVSQRCSPIMIFLYGWQHCISQAVRIRLDSSVRWSSITFLVISFYWRLFNILNSYFIEQKYITSLHKHFRGYKIFFENFSKEEYLLIFLIKHVYKFILML